MSAGQTELTPALDFEPVSADVAPQMSLFGGGPPAPAAPKPAPAAARWLTPDDLADPEPIHDSVPAFERRARLRDERHRLVSEVRRRDGTSHREINAWLNRAIGITSVERGDAAPAGEIGRAADGQAHRASLSRPSLA